MPVRKRHALAAGETPKITALPDVMSVEEFRAQLLGLPAKPRRASGSPVKEHAFGALWLAHDPPLPPFRRQWLFARAILGKTAKAWRVDYGWPDFSFAVEVDGGIWMKGGGAHSHPANLIRQMAKGNDAVRCGVRLIRITTDDAASGAGVAYVRDVMRELRILPDSQ